MKTKILVASGMLLPFAALAEPVSHIGDQLPPQSELVGKLLLPVPSAIFGSLDRFADSNWKSVQRPALAHSVPGSEQAVTALRLGAVIAEGFIAVEAKDAPEIQDIGVTLLKLSRALGVEKSVLTHSQSIMDHAKRSDWTAVRAEWSAVNSDIKAAMIKLESEQIAQLVSLGGWLRGTEALTVVVSQHYSQSGAALLHQPAMLDYFKEHLARMNVKLRLNAIVVQIEEVFPKLQSLTAQPGGIPISEADVESFRADIAKIIDAIDADKSGKAVKPNRKPS